VVVCVMLASCVVVVVFLVSQFMRVFICIYFVFVYKHCL